MRLFRTLAVVALLVGATAADALAQAAPGTTAVPPAQVRRGAAGIARGNTTIIIVRPRTHRGRRHRRGYNVRTPYGRGVAPSAVPF